MFPQNLTQPQREAVFDLLLLGMYADGNLKLVENAGVYALTEQLGWESYQDRSEYSDTAIARVRAANETEASTAVFLTHVSERLGSDDVRKLALGLLTKLIEADHQAAESEAGFYQKAQAIFGV
jgi:uncharacterized tellurite resistance protein B-like protein